MTRSWWVSRINVDRGACRIVSRIKFVLSPFVCMCECVCSFVVFFLSLSLSPSFYHFLQISRSTRKNRVGGERMVVENCLRSSLISRSSRIWEFYLCRSILLDILGISCCNWWAERSSSLFILSRGNRLSPMGNHRRWWNRRFSFSFLFPVQRTNTRLREINRRRRVWNPGTEIY